MKKVLYCFVLVLSLAGCGYKPLYSSSSDGRGVVASLSSISIQETDTRAGQLVRNSLLSSIRPAGTAGDDRYKLILNPELTQSTLVDQSLPGIKRIRLRLTVTYQLTATGVSAVPHPAALPLLLVGLGAIGLVGRRSRRKS